MSAVCRLICQGQEKIVEGYNGMFSILYMHFFNAYQAELHSREIGSYRRESTFFQLSNQISVDFMLEEHLFIFIKLFRTNNFSTHY